ncbi:transmembrane sensor [Pseudomonas aeruginosa VRFPA02]|nr:transmembrane sensor [Pseudomonas aeruginosa VRFPA02]
MNSPQEQQQIRQQAAEWAIRLDGGDLDRSRREALDGWLAADPRRRELGEGESLRYSAEGGVEAPLGGRLDDLTSWRRGLLVFDEQPLGEVVARLNRYRPGHLLVAPGALAQRRVSGVFRVADLEASLQSISDELGVRSLGLAGVTLLY